MVATLPTAYRPAIRAVGARQAARLASTYQSVKALQLAANAFAESMVTAQGVRGEGEEDSAAPGEAAAVPHRRRRRRSTATADADAAARVTGEKAVAAAAQPGGLSGVLGANLAAWFSHADSKLLLNELRQAGVAAVQEDPAALGFSSAEEALDTTHGLGVDAPAQNGRSSSSRRRSSSSSSNNNSDSGGGGAAPLAGVSLCLTGTLSAPGLERRTDAQAWAAARGALVHSSVRRSTNWLVAGTNPGASKIAAAARLGVRCMSEAEFLEEVAAREDGRSLG
jgi:NAD-dependent DNA ligase